MVGVNSDGNGYTAIQFYDKEATVPKAGVDSFIASSNKPFFTKRFLVATNEHWTDPVKEEFRRQTPPVTLITRETLASSTVDWAAYQRGELKEVAKRTPRDYQKEAIKKVISGFKTASKGKLIMAWRHRQDLHFAEDSRRTSRRRKVGFIFSSVFISALSDTHRLETAVHLPH